MNQKAFDKDFIGKSEEQLGKFDTPRNRQVFFSLPGLVCFEENNICILTQSAFYYKIQGDCMFVL